MNPIGQFPFREIAENTLAKYFGKLDADLRNELATSLVRQWVSNDGHAGFVTPTHQFWFQVIPMSDGVEVKCRPVKKHWGRVLSQKWDQSEDEIPGLLHQLNLCQIALFRIADGRTISMRVEPKKRRVRCEEGTEAEESEL
jgi:hypothetical protein